MLVQRVNLNRDKRTNLVSEERKGRGLECRRKRGTCFAVCADGLYKVA